MTASEKDYCPKCITGTLGKLNREEMICLKCGKVYGRPQGPPPAPGYVPRPGGNRCAG